MLDKKGRNKNQNNVTLEDIAKLSNVSVSTVSRVINNGSVSEKTKKRVKEIIRQTNYSPNAIARSLRGGKTNTIAFIVPDITNPFFTQIINEFGKMYRDKKYSIIICNTFDDPNIEQSEIESLAERRVDGLVVTSSAASFAKIYEDINQNCPVILLDRLISKKLDSIRTDNIDGSMHAVSYLINKGRKNILTIAGPQHFTPGKERYEGYLKTLDFYNISPDKELVKFGDFTKRSGYLLTKEALHNNKPIDAIFAANNFMGVGAIEALKSENYKIPDDIALIMFDDLDLANIVDPPITVVKQSTKEIGREVGELLMSRLNNDEIFEPKQIMIKSKLEIRKSV